MSWLGGLQTEREQAKAKSLDLKLLHRQAAQNQNKLGNKVAKLESRIAYHNRRRRELHSDLDDARILEALLAAKLFCVERELSLYAPRPQPESAS